MRREIITFCLLMVVLTMAGCWKQQPTISGFECKLDKGAFWHDVHLTNKSGMALREVKVTLTVVGEDGDPRSEERYYAMWANGKTVNFSLKVANSPINLQKISLAGVSTEGKLGASWVTQ